MTTLSSPLPKVTVAIISWDRLHYLRATLESARRCIQYPNLEWIVSDNESSEPGLPEYLQSLDWVDLKLIKRQTHAAAMNEIVAKASGEFLLLWPDDVQFVVEGDWLKDLVEIMTDHPFIGSMGLDGMRRCTLASLFRPWWRRDPREFLREFRRYGLQFRFNRLLTSSRGRKVRTCGSAMLGICPSGIPSLTRMDVWRRLGPWKTTQDKAKNLVDSSLGAEDDMILRFRESRWPLQTAIPLIPVASDIVTDPTGCKAKNRGRFRYGVYFPPPEGTFYYRIRREPELPAPSGMIPLSFSDITEAMGFSIPTDANGDRLKSSLNKTVVFDRELNSPVPPPA